SVTSSKVASKLFAQIGRNALDTRLGVRLVKRHKQGGSRADQRLGIFKHLHPIRMLAGGVSIAADSVGNDLRLRVAAVQDVDQPFGHGHDIGTHSRSSKSSLTPRASSSACAGEAPY